jgi:trehalose monomycolate/heme transporter
MEVPRVFAALGRFDYRFRRWLVPAALAIVIAINVAVATWGGELSQGGWEIPGSESEQAEALLRERFGASQEQMLVIYRDEDADATSSIFQDKVAASLEQVAADDTVDSVITYGAVPDPSLISEDGHATFAVVNLTQGRADATADAERLAALVDPPGGIEMTITGVPLLQQQFNAAIEADLLQAELISLPVALVILLVVFGTVVGAALPLLIAGLALGTAFAAISIMAGQIEMSIFVTNIATMIGLALAIDYSLFMVSRFREELRAGYDVPRAIERMMATVGKAVAVSGIAVAIGLTALIVFSAPALRSMGIGGVLVVVSTLLFGLTALPALLAMLGPNVNRLRVPLPAFIRPASGNEPAEQRHGVWSRIARFVMRRPLQVATPALALLLLAGLPFLHLELSTGGNLDDLPPSSARTGFEMLRDEFPGGDSNPVIVALQFPDDELNADRQDALAAYADRLAGVDGATQVRSLLTPPPGMTADQYLPLLALPAEQRPAELNDYIAGWFADDTTRLEVASRIDADTDAGRAFVQRVRGVEAPAGAQVLTAGLASQSSDFLAAFDAAIPVAVAIVIGVTFIVLFLTFGSVLLPVKAVLMSLLSISASFGALVWIFQDGNFSNLLGFEAGGTVIASTPVIMFAILFGLSMDYEVLLLSRIRERYVATGDNNRSVAEGIGVTGGIITGAALIMVGVFGAFALGDVVMIKALGFAMALAVLVDATIVRGILVPAFMRIMGELNWWAPRGLQRAVARLGLYEGPIETDASGAAQPAGADGVAEGASAR